jgi:hypothetical protein
LDTTEARSGPSAVPCPLNRLATSAPFLEQRGAVLGIARQREGREEAVHHRSAVRRNGPEFLLGPGANRGVFMPPHPVPSAPRCRSPRRDFSVVRDRQPAGRGIGSTHQRLDQRAPGGGDQPGRGIDQRIDRGGIPEPADGIDAGTLGFSDCVGSDQRSQRVLHRTPTGAWTTVEPSSETHIESPSPRPRAPAMTDSTAGSQGVPPVTFHRGGGELNGQGPIGKAWQSTGKRLTANTSFRFPRVRARVVRTIGDPGNTGFNGCVPAGPVSSTNNSGAAPPIKATATC